MFFLADGAGDGVRSEFDVGLVLGVLVIGRRAWSMIGRGGVPREGEQEYGLHDC